MSTGDSLGYGQTGQAGPLAEILVFALSLKVE